MGLFSKNKQPKPLKLKGKYYSSHPDIHGQYFLRLEFSEAGVDAFGAKKKEPAIKHFDWSEVSGFETSSEDKTQLQTTQRVTATRMVAGGVFALAAPKKSTHGNVGENFVDVLFTTSGNIELETEINAGGSGSLGDANRSAAKMIINTHKFNAKNIKRYVAEHAKAKPVSAKGSESAADEIAKYAKLKDDGAITQKEFEAKKKSLLGL